MNFNNLTPDEWWNNYESMSEQEQFDFMKEFLEQGMSPEFAQEIDLVSTIIGIFEHLMKERQYDKVLELQALLNDLKPEVLDGEKYYSDSFAIEVHLFKKNGEAVKKSLNSFIENPVRAIDLMIPVVDKLKYYGYGELAEFLCKEVYHEVSESEDLIGRAEEDFARVILLMEFQKLYINKCEGRITERKDFLSKLKLYGFDDENELGLSYDNVLIDNDFCNLTYENFNTNKRDFFQKLFIGFSKYVYDNKAINFPTAYDIWSGAWEGFYLDNPSDKKSGRLDSFFKLNTKALYDYVSKGCGFLSNRKPHVFAVLWGTQYVYDFLKLNHLVSDANYAEAQDFLKHTKMEIIEGLGESAWEYNFVHTWLKPDSNSEEEFNREKEYFEKTFLEKVDIKEYLPGEYFRRRALMQKEAMEKGTYRNDSIKTGRNDPCPCGSGKKYKKCCGA